MFFAGLGTAVPAPRYTQSECWEAFRAAPQFARLAPPGRALLERVLRAEQGVHTRHLALERLEDALDIDPDVLHRRFAAHAPELATRAAREALEQARLDPGELDAILVSTCTGYLCPGLTSYVGERLGLRASALALDLVGQGCGAALPNLGVAEALIASRRCRRVLSVCVEVCSAAMYIDDDPGVLISACLFGDGAAAAVLSDEPPAAARRVQWVGSASRIHPEERESLRMESRGGLLRNVLSRRVPALAAELASEVLDEGLERYRLKRADIRGWVWHAGGRTVLERLRQATDLTERDTRHSADILARFGNLSSPFVLFVLQAALAAEAPEGWWWMSSFGAGFSCHGALLRVCA
jgi:predicted naringenin-chalcone synthase